MTIAGKALLSSRTVLVLACAAVLWAGHADEASARGRADGMERGPATAGATSATEQDPPGTTLLAADTAGVQVWEDGRGGIVVRTDARLLAPSALTEKTAGPDRTIYRFIYYPRRLILARDGQAFEVSLPGGNAYVPPVDLQSMHLRSRGGPPETQAGHGLDLSGGMDLPLPLPSAAMPLPGTGTVLAPGGPDLSVPPGLASGARAGGSP